MNTENRLDILFQARAKKYSTTIQCKANKTNPSVKYSQHEKTKTNKTKQNKITKQPAKHD